MEKTPGKTIVTPAAAVPRVSRKIKTLDQLIKLLAPFSNQERKELIDAAEIMLPSKKEVSPSEA